MATFYGTKTTTMGKMADSNFLSDGIQPLLKEIKSELSFGI
jgi:hypothetical protein